MERINSEELQNLITEKELLTQIVLEESTKLKDVQKELCEGLNIANSLYEKINELRALRLVELKELEKLELEKSKLLDQKIELNEKILEDMREVMRVQSIRAQMDGAVKGVESAKRNITFSGEEIYIQRLYQILEFGRERPDRTGVGTKSIFNINMTFDLTDNRLPLMTQRKLSWKNIWAELLFFLRGQTDASILIDQGVRIWNGNSDRTYLDKIGLTNRAEFDLGPVYGWQWRHFGADYTDSKADYTGKGIDQLSEVINTLKKDPYSRRLMVTAWNPEDLKQMVLPPCHHTFQFYVSDGKLSCLLNQRSGDMVLGIPYNIASYSLLTHIVAQLVGLKADKFHINIGDAHIYKNHIGELESMLALPSYNSPVIRWVRTPNNIDDIKFDDIVLEQYTSGPIIKFQMAV